MFCGILEGTGSHILGDDDDERAINELSLGRLQISRWWQPDGPRLEVL